MNKLLAVSILALTFGKVTPALAGEVTGSAMACFPDPSYPLARPPQCMDLSGLSMYTETGGPSRDLQYHGSTFDQVGSGSFTLDLGSLTLVGAGIRSAIDDELHLSVNLADQNGEIGTATYLISTAGFAFYDTIRRQSVGQVSLDFGSPQTYIFNTAFGAYAFTLETPPSPLLLSIPSGSATGYAEAVSYEIIGTLISIPAPEAGTRLLIATPEPGTMPLLMSGVVLALGVLKQKRRAKRTLDLSGRTLKRLHAASC